MDRMKLHRKQQDLFRVFPILHNERVTLRRIQEKDISQLQEIYDAPLPYENACMLERECERWYKERKEVVLGIFGKDGTLLGLLEIYHVSRRSAEIGYRIRNAYRRQGYACSALHLLMRYLKDKTGIYRITARTHAANTASAALLKKCGFRKVRTKDNILEYEFLLQGKSMVQWMAREGI